MKKKAISRIIALVLAIATSIIIPSVCNADAEEEQNLSTTEVSVAATAAETTTEPTTEVTTVEVTEQETTELETTTESTTVDEYEDTDDYDYSYNDSGLDGVELQYSAPYYITSDRLTQSGGVAYYNGHRETWYSQNVLPGYGLSIPGRHVADDGTVRDGDGYICVASDYSYYSYGSILMTSLGPAKVYDTGCDYGTIDVYVNW